LTDGHEPTIVFASLAEDPLSMTWNDQFSAGPLQVINDEEFARPCACWK